MRKHLVFSPAAISDLDRIWDYTIDRWGPDQADYYTDMICDACFALAESTKMGRIVDIRPGYMKYLSGSHIIYYRQETSKIIVVRILHNRMDVEAHL